MAEQKRLFLLDAYALIFRGYYAFIKNPRINSKGMDTSAIMGFTNSLLDVIRREKPDHLAVAFDKGGSVARTEAFPEYKANRLETPEAIKIAVPYIHKILEAMHIPIIEKEGYEADDLIGTLSMQAEKAGYMTYMVTHDKEFAQIVKNDYGVKRKPITTRNPQANSIIERVHQTIGNIIRTFEMNKKTDIDEEDPWSGVLTATMFAIRATYHMTNQATPAQLVFGRDAILNTTFEANWQYIRERKQKIINENNKKENLKRIPHHYHVGD